MKAPIPDISRDLFDLTGYCSIVTGASVGIGLSIAEALAYKGSDIVLVSRNAQRLEEAAEKVRAIGRRAVAIAIEVNLRSGTVRAEGDLDFRGTLGVDKAAPVGFKAIRLTFEIDTDAPQDKIDQLLKLTERYCVVFQSLNNRPALEARMVRA